MSDPDDKTSEQPFDAVQAAAEFAAAMAKEPAEAGEVATKDAGQDRYTALLEEEVEALKGVLAQKESALEVAEGKVAAAEAEVERVREQIERRTAGTIDQKHRAVVASFLDVADAMDRAVAELAHTDAPAALADGLRGVRDQLQGVLRGHGALRQPSMGERFDAAHHEAIATAPATAEAPAGTITAVLSEGYTLGESTLRAARVVVAKD